MKRREVIAVLGACVAWPIAIRAQQPAMPVIGLLSARVPGPPEVAAIRQGLAESGYVEGRNVTIEHRWAEGQFDRLPTLAADLARHRVALIIATGLTSATAARAVTATIPLVILAADDPVKFGLVVGLNQPGSNVTGVNLLTSELKAKRLEFLRELLPAIGTVAALSNPRSPEAMPQLSDLQAAARKIGQRLRILNASSDGEIEAAFAAIVNQQDAALLVTNDPLFISRRDELVALAARYAVPTIYDRRAYTVAGGLISYGTDYLDGYRKLGI